VLALLVGELRPFMPYLDNDSVQEIFVNPNGNIFVDFAGKAREHVGVIHSSQVLCLISTIASTLGTTVTPEKPTLDGTLIYDGSRFSGEIPPVVTAPSFRIRKHANAVQPLRFHRKTDVINDVQYDFICNALRAHKNIIIVGATASGKTFFANSLIKTMHDLTPRDRIVAIEDTRELNITQSDSMSWLVTDHVDMRMMLHRVLRATPDRIVIGEVRDGAAYQLLKMWCTGHAGGLCTIHSDKGPLDGLKRLERMCRENEETQGMDARWIKELVADAADVMISLVRTESGRSVPMIVEVHGLKANGDYDYTIYDQ